MPTKHPRIAVTKDDELAEALANVERLFDGAPAAAIVHDLAVRGADAMLDADSRRRKAIERLIERSTSGDGFDYRTLAHVRNDAWR